MSTTLDPDRILIDVRTPAEFAEVHIPGSRNVPLGDLDAALEELLREAGGKDLCLVCRTGQRAGAARQKLAAAGIDCAVVLEGGLQAWQAQGQPVNRGKAAMSLERQVRIFAGALVVAGVSLGALIHPAFTALSAFIGLGLVWSGATDTCGMAMMLAKMPWNRRAAPAQPA